jgi:cytidine deaminase
MKERNLVIPVKLYAGVQELEPEDAALLENARRATGAAYAPYSRFRVAAAVRLANGQVITGTNQENASYPAGLCAERVALSAASSACPAVPVTAMAVSYFQEAGNNAKPVSPCGICRQTLAEYEIRGGGPIRLILGAAKGEIWVIARASDLLPLAFTAAEMGRDDLEIH